MYLFTDELLCIRMAICVVLIVVVVLCVLSVTDASVPHSK